MENNHYNAFKKEKKNRMAQKAKKTKFAYCFSFSYLWHYFSILRGQCLKIHVFLNNIMGTSTSIQMDYKRLDIERLMCHVYFT